MKFATVAECPVLWRQGRSMSTTARRKHTRRAASGRARRSGRRGRRHICGAAWQGLDALEITWDEGPNAKINSADIWSDLRAASKKDGVVAKSEGDVKKASRRRRALRGRLRAAVPRPCRLEPMNCTVRLTPGCLRDLDRHASSEPGAGGCGQGRGPADRESDGQQPLYWAAASAAGSSRTWS